MTQDTIARVLIFLVQLGLMSAYAFIICSFLFYPAFIIARVKQIYKSDYDAGTFVPTQVALTYLFSAAFGIILPTLLIVTMRGHTEFWKWEFAEPLNTFWKSALAMVAMLWLAARLLEAALNHDRPRFSGYTDRIVSIISVWVCMPYIMTMLMFNIHDPMGPRELFITFYLPPLCVLGTMLVYLSAFLETFRPSKVVRRRRKIAWGIALAGGFVAFSPIWISAPRVTHRQAMSAIETHLKQINEAAQAAEIDPRLLAGVIYVAQTRDRSRVTFSLQRKISGIIDHEPHRYWRLRSILNNPPIGTLPLRTNDQIEILNYIERTSGFGKYALDFATTGTIAFVTSYGEHEWNLHVNQTVPDALVDLIQSKPCMDGVFNSLINGYQYYLKRCWTDDIRSISAARMHQMILPMLEYTWDLVPLQQNMNEAATLMDEAEQMEDSLYLLDPSILLYMTLFHDRHCLFQHEQPDRFQTSHWFEDAVRVLDDDEMNILLGAAMLKLLDEEASAETSGYEHLLRIASLSPYGNPDDFAGRLEKIMHSPEFDRLFGPANAPKKEAAR